MKDKQGIMLDIGIGAKQPKFVRMGKGEADIFHDLEVFPWPLEDNSCLTILGNHIIERIDPKLTIQFMDECWRVLKPDCQLALSTPYAGSKAFWSDPMNINGFTELKFMHFSADYPPLYDKYKPKPWIIEKGFPVYQLNGNIEVVMRKNLVLDQYALLAQRAVGLGAIQKASELTDFFHFIKDRKIKTAVEIGTARGGVFYALCQMATDEASIISIDMPDGKFGGGYSEEDAQRFKSYGKLKQKLHFIREDSHKKETSDQLQKILGKGKVDLLFIDGDHTYEGVKSDYQMYSPFVKKDGLIVFHDICFHPAFPDCKVDQFWKEIKRNRKYKEFIDQKDNVWGGIGVLWQK